MNIKSSGLVVGAAFLVLTGCTAPIESEERVGQTAEALTLVSRTPPPSRAEISFTCGANSFTLSTGNSKGSCTTSCTGDWCSAHCDDGGGNSSAAYCDRGHQGCASAYGSGSCTQD